MSKMYTIEMPDIGEGVVEGEVIEWLKQIGDDVKQDEPVVVVMTDKATVELPSPYPGKLAKQYYEVGQMAERGQPLYVIASEQKETVAEVKKEVKKELPIVAKKTLQPTHTQEHVLAIPAVRKAASNLGIDLGKIKGTGSHGQVTWEDMRLSLRQPQKHSIPRIEGDEELPLVGVRHQMALQMKEAHEEIPQFSYFEQVDATRLIQLKENFKEEALQEHLQITFMPFFIRALSLTLQKYPEINSSYDPQANKLIVHKHQNIGIAFTSEEGLIVPVLKEVEKLKLADIVRQFELLKKKAKNRKLQPSDMREGTVTISNYGVLGGGGLFATPLIHSPEVAILALAKIQKQAIVKQNKVVICDLLNLSWSFDHRIIDGSLAARVSHYFCGLIQNPAQLL